MNDATSRAFALLALLIGVWVVAYWLYDPTRPAPVSRDDRPAPEAAAPPAPKLPEPQSLPPVPPPQHRPDPEPTPTPPKLPEQVVLPPEFDDYTVRAGDRSLQDIARRVYGDAAKWEVIARANPLFTPDRLKPGVTVLRIPRDPDNIQGKLVQIRPPDPVPQPKPDPKPDDGWRTYVVQESDTLWGIAKKVYGRGSLTALIAEANTDVLPDPDRIKAGITLRIPPAPPAD